MANNQQTAVEIGQFPRAFPDDPLKEILKRLPFEELKKARLICRRWNQVIEKSVFNSHKNLKLCFADRQCDEVWDCNIEPEDDLYVLETVLQRHKAVRNLELNLERLCILTPRFQNFKSLKVLNLNYVQLDSDSIASLQDLPLLHTVEFHFCELDGSNLHLLNDNIRALKFEGCKLEKGSLLNALRALHSRGVPLECVLFFNIPRWNMSGGNDSSLTKFCLENFSSLKEFILHYTDDTPQNIETMAAINIETFGINISCSNNTNFFMKVFKCPFLKIEYLVLPQMNDLTLQNCLSMCSSSTLRHLIFDTNSRLETFLPCLLQLKALEYMKNSSSKFCFHDMVSLTMLPKLKRVDLGELLFTTEEQLERSKSHLDKVFQDQEEEWDREFSFMREQNGGKKKLQGLLSRYGIPLIKSDYRFIMTIKKPSPIINDLKINYCNGLIAHDFAYDYTVCGSNDNIARLKNILKSHPQIKRLMLKSSDSYNLKLTKLMPELGKFENVCELRLENIFITEKDFDCLNSLKNLSTLEFIKCSFNAESLWNLRGLISFKNLKRLKFYDCENFPKYFLSRFLVKLHRNKSALECLDIQNINNSTSLSERISPAIHFCLENFSSLKKLIVSEANIIPSGLNKMAAVDLETLELSNFTQSDENISMDNKIEFLEKIFEHQLCNLRDLRLPKLKPETLLKFLKSCSMPNLENILIDTVTLKEEDLLFNRLLKFSNLKTATFRSDMKLTFKDLVSMVRCLTKLEMAEIHKFVVPTEEEMKSEVEELKAVLQDQPRGRRVDFKVLILESDNVKQDNVSYMQTLLNHYHIISNIDKNAIKKNNQDKDWSYYCSKYGSRFSEYNFLYSDDSYDSDDSESDDFQSDSYSRCHKEDKICESNSYLTISIGIDLLPNHPSPEQNNV